MNENIKWLENLIKLTTDNLPQNPLSKEWEVAIAELDGLKQEYRKLISEYNND